MQAKLLNAAEAWLPNKSFRLGAAPDFSPGSLLLYPRNPTAGGEFELCLRVGGGGSVFCLTDMGGGTASTGDLIDLSGWRERLIGLDALSHGLPVLELNLSVGYAPHPSYDDHRGGFMTVGANGVQLLARARGYGGPEEHAPIDPAEWSEVQPRPPQDQPIWIGTWRLRVPIGADDALVFDCVVD